MQLSTLFVVFVLTVASVAATPATSNGDLMNSAKRQTFDDCFNAGFEDGEAAGCNAALNQRKRDANVKRATAISCTGSNVDAFNEGFNEGFQDGFNSCSS